MRRLLGASLLVLAAGGRSDALPVPNPSELLKVSARVTPSPGSGRGTLRVEAKLAAGWHVNSHRPSEDYLIGTSINLVPVTGVSYGEARYPVGKLKKFAFADKPLSVYEDRFTIEIPVSWNIEMPRPPSLSGSVDFQACSDTQCLAPASVSFHVEGSPPIAALSGGARPLAEAPLADSTLPSVPGATQDLGDLLRRRGFLFVIPLLFLGGLALNLTPCVYPVIPLTVSFFGGQAKGDSRRLFALASLYVLGMATMYSALGVVAALSGRLFGVAFQSPWVLSGVAAVLVGLALSMFGFYDIRMPTFLMQKAGARSGAAGAYAMGMLVGIVAAPCVGPFVLGLLAFVAARQDAFLGFLFFFVLSLGLGLPYLVLALFSGSLSRLPRSGEWMDEIKKIFGWVLLAMAAYFVQTVIPPPAGDWLLPAVLLAGAVALLAGVGSSRLILRVSAAALFLAAAIVFAPRRTAASGAPEWRPYVAAQVARAGRPAVIDFSASWCVPCLELDQKTFSDPRVRKALVPRALFKADLTKAASPEAVAISQRYAILGVPTVIFLDASGKEQSDLRLVGFEDAETFLKRLEKAP